MPLFQERLLDTVYNEKHNNKNNNKMITQRLEIHCALIRMHKDIILKSHYSTYHSKVMYVGSGCY